MSHWYLQLSQWYIQPSQWHIQLPQSTYSCFSSPRSCLSGTYSCLSEYLQLRQWYLQLLQWYLVHTAGTYNCSNYRCFSSTYSHLSGTGSVSVVPIAVSVVLQLSRDYAISPFFSLVNIRNLALYAFPLVNIWPSAFLCGRHLALYASLVVTPYIICWLIYVPLFVYVCWLKQFCI